MSSVAEVYRGTTDAQRHGAQTEVQLRSQTPFGLIARGVQPTLGNKVLTAKAREHIAPKNFALPGGRYPVNDKAHARNALARVSQNGTPAEKAKVRAKVAHKFPGIGG